jgi:hypothetical protein
MSPAIDALRAAGYGLERRYDGSHDGSSEGFNMGVLLNVLIWVSC